MILHEVLLYPDLELVVGLELDQMVVRKVRFFLCNLVRNGYKSNTHMIISRHSNISRLNLTLMTNAWSGGLEMRRRVCCFWRRSIGNHLIWYLLIYLKR